MTKVELEVKLEALQKLLDEKANEQASYASQIRDLEKQLKDINKPKLTPLQFDELRDAIEEAIGQWDFSDTDNYSIDYGIDYDGRVHCESFDFDNADDLGREIYNYISELFAEADAPEDEISIQEHLNQD
jgi:hypothetical protein